MQCTVKAGDTLSKIARDELGNIELWRGIAFRNKIMGPNFTVYPGQVLELPDEKAIEAVQTGRGAGTFDDPRRFTTGTTITASAPAGGGVKPWQRMLLWGGLIGIAVMFFFPPKQGALGGLIGRRSRPRRGRSGSRATKAA
jgi:LysM repeat protein